VRLLRLSEGRWQAAGRLAGIAGVVRSVRQDRDGAVYLAWDDGGGLVLVYGAGLARRHAPLPPRRRPGAAPPPRSPSLRSTDALPSAPSRVSTALAWTPASPGCRCPLVPDSTYGLAFADSSRDVYRLVQDRRGDAWIAGDETIGFVPRGGDRRRLAVARPQAVPHLASMALLPEADGVLWVGTTTGSPASISAAERRLDGFRPLLRVSAVDPDSLLHACTPAAWPPACCRPGSARCGSSSRRPASTPGAHGIPASPGRLRRQVSDWSLDTRKDYTNLAGGQLSLPRAGADLYGHRERETGYDFTMPLPWTQAWWAYAASASCSSSGALLAAG